MNIRVNVISAGALARLKAVDMAATKAGNGVGSVGRQAQWGLPYLSKWGNQVQWAGRQLIYNFTLPIAMAMGMASKFALENEQAMTRVTKVYGDGSKQFRRLAKTEIPALQDAFVALSNRFGIHQKEVIGIAGDWAAAGASGIALAKSVKLTLETMVLGELEAAEATQNLIAIQAQYGQNINDLTKTIDILNMVENQTGTSMKGLMDGMARAAGVARDAGVDVEHLAAMMAALTPATGSAATAGNGLKTIISRILSPTQEGVAVMRLMGTEVDSLGWQSLNATQRLERMAEQFQNLDKAQRVHVSTVIASRWQINRFSQLMRDITNENGYYQKSLKATSDASRIYAQRQFELNKVLESNPQRVKQAWVILQNAAADVITPLLPTIAYLASELARLASAFANLDPEIQKLVLGGLIFLALIGPLARYIGSVSNLVGLLAASFHFLARGVGFLVMGPLKLLAPIFGSVGTAAGGMAAGVGAGMVKAWGFIKWFTGLMLLVPGLIGKGMLAIGPMLSRFWVVMQASTTAGWAAIRSIWIAAQLGIVTATGAMAVTIQSVWALLHINLFKISRTAFAKLIGIVGKARLLLVGVWGAIGLAILGIVYAFRNQIADAWNNMINNLQNNEGLNNLVKGWHAVVGSIIDAFWALPKGVRDALLSVLRIVQSIVVQVYDWLSYLNPFATHSPSLVNSVTRGMDEIERQYGRAAKLGGVFKAAARDLAIFKKAAARNTGSQFADERKDVKKSGGNTALFDRMTGHLKRLQPLLARQANAVRAQEAVVARWEQKLNDANAALDRQQAKLDRIQGRLQEAQEEYDRHAQKLQDFASAPIKGMGAMEDAIFANEMAQKKLRLEMLKFEQANGSVDDLRNRLAMLYGDIEELRGNASDLRSAGAGSEILGPIGAQIAAMEAQANAMASAVNNSPVGKMQDQIDQLARQGEILELEKSIKFDPMVREIDKLANAQKELSYDQIVNGINRQRAAMEELEPTIKRLTSAAEAQQAVVDRFTARRDEVQAGYDREQDQLSALQDAYQKTSDIVQELESALNDMGQTAAEAIQKAKDAAKKAEELKAKKKKLPDEKSLTQAEKTFKAGEGADWADVGRNAQIGRLGGMEDQSGLIDKFAQEQIDKMNKIFGGFDMFAPIKEWWRKTWAWLKENVGPVVRAVGDTIKSVFGAIPNPFDNEKVTGGFSKAFDKAKDIVTRAWEIISGTIKLFAPDVRRIFDAIVEAGERLWNKVGPEVAKFGDVLDRMRTHVLPPVLNILEFLAKFIGGTFLITFKLVASLVSHLFGPVLNFVVDTIAAVIRVIRGVLEFIVGFITGDFALAWQGIRNILGGFVDFAVGLFEGLWNVLTGIFWSLMHGIKEAWDWIVDVLVGHSIIPDLIDTIWDLFKGLIDLALWIWDEVLKPVYDKFVNLWQDTKAELNKWWERIKSAWSAIKDAAKWIWDEVLSPVYDKFINIWHDIKAELTDWWTRIKSAWSSIVNSIADWWQNNIWNPVKNKVAGAWTDFREEISQWWDRIKNTWSNITTNIGDWWVNNIWTPVKNKVSGAWTDIRAEISEWWERMKNTWSNITSNIGDWFKRNVTDPIFNKITGVWEDIKTWFLNHKDIITGPIQGVVNGAISAINAMIKGLNKISDVLPGLDWKIELIPTLATGGTLMSRRVGSGFKTTGARAIVGEGKGNYPEYVIPTDPTHRRRAQSLLMDAAGRMGMVPQYSIGGVLGDTIGDIVGKASDMAKGGLSWMKGNLEAIVSTLFGPMRQAADKLVSKIGWMPAQTSVRSVLDQVIKWVSAADGVFKKKADKIAEETGSWNGKISEGIRAAQNFARSQVGKPYKWGGTGPDGFDCSGFMSAITAYLRGQGPFGIRYGATASFPWPGFNPGRGAFTIGSTPNYGGSGIGHMAGTLGNLNVESAGGVGVRVGSSARGWNDSGFSQHAHLKGLAAGAIIRRTRGGIGVRVGEGRYDEAVTPLPRNWRNDAFNTGSGNREINIYGNLEFPNIRSGNDAEEFIANLERVV